MKINNFKFKINSYGKIAILLITVIVVLVTAFASSRSPVLAQCAAACSPACNQAWAFNCPGTTQQTCHENGDCAQPQWNSVCCTGGGGPQPPTKTPTPSITPIPTVPINPTATTTPPAPVTSRTNPRGCGILWTSGVPSCWCNNGGGQGLCVDPARNRNLSIAQCRTLCESGTFNGPLGYTHCFIMTSGAQCASNNDGSYRFCLNECMQGNPGYMHTVGCIFPNSTIFGPATRSAACDAAVKNSSNATFFTMIENVIKGAINYITANNYRMNLVRVPGLQKATCNPFKLECERGYTSF